MRSLAPIAAAATFMFAASASAQSMAEHAAAAAGATIGSAAGKPMANALSNIFGQVDQATATAAKSGSKSKGVKTTIAPEQADADKSSSANRVGGPGAFTPTPDDGQSASADLPAPRARSRRNPAPLKAVPAAVMAVVPEPIKEPSLEEVAAIKLGTTEREVFAALGVPESHIIVPDDDGHIRESCQYWAHGRQLGTIRLDNGQVVRVEVRAEN